MKALVLKKHGTLDELQVVADYPVPQAVEGLRLIQDREIFGKVVVTP